MKLPRFLVLFLMGLPAFALPRVTVLHDDTPIRESCEVVIPADQFISDDNTNGVLRIEADDITVRFVPGSVLRGAPLGTPGDQLKGVGIMVEGRRSVRIEGARVHGFFNGIHASRADGLVIDGGDFSENYRQRLRSTPVAEDGADWLFPHHNDERPWRLEYGAAISIATSSEVVVRGVRVRRGQNGIVLDRVDRSRFYDNDCSFLSGWGIALWRSSRNSITRNAFDFCVRGHVEGVYNRGQDSAGILCFEQCNENVFAENSATHGGDGFFGFAGREALGEAWIEQERVRLQRETARSDTDTQVPAPVPVPDEVARRFSALGCNRNVLIGNDFSYASAHGIEMTFSEGNVYASNRLVENAICGVWGGYSSDTVIVRNEVSGNGGMAYGLERGGINMEHASGNRILENTFRDNKCGIHLWWDDDAALLRLPGVSGNDRGVTGNIIASNTFLFTSSPPLGMGRANETRIALQLRDPGTGRVRDNLYVGNRVSLDAPDAREFALEPGTEPATNGVAPSFAVPAVQVFGVSRPVGARAHLRGRDRIVLDEWGPWDHEQPFMRPRSGGQGEAAFDVFGLSGQPAVEVQPGTVKSLVAASQNSGAWRVSFQIPPGAGVVAYRGVVAASDWRREVAGTLVSTRWDVEFFPWTIDPREDLEGWRQQGKAPAAVRTTAAALHFAYGGGGPRDLDLDDAVSRRGPGADHFGMMARTRLRLPAGSWLFQTTSDDGVRVMVNGTRVIDNWTWHGPTVDRGVYRQTTEGEVLIEVEHFEVDGYAVLQLALEAGEAAD